MVCSGVMRPKAGTNSRTKMTFDIRIARLEDAADACEVLRRSIADCCLEDHRGDPAILEAWLANKTPDNVRCWISSPAHLALVAARAERIRGIAMLQRAGKILLLYVDPAHRFHGAGTALLQALESHAAQAGIRALHVSSTLTARAFYLAQGYTEAGRAPSAFGSEAIRMSKAIPARYPRKGICRCTGA